MSPRQARAAARDPIASIAFDRRKYGLALDADAAEVSELGNYIVAPRPHRLDFYELVLLRAAPGSIDIDGRSFRLAGGRVLCTRPGEVRCWRLDAAPAGWVVCFAPELFDLFFADPGFVDGLPFFAAEPRRPCIDLAPPAWAALATLARAMRSELQTPRPDTQHLLRALTYQLLLQLARQQPPADTDRLQGDPAAALVRRFRALVERRFRRDTQVQAYARCLGVTAGHLNQCVREALGISAGTLIRARRLLEARRLLLYGDTTVRQVATQLGFEDASYFNRFFSRQCGQTPLEFRRSFGNHRAIGRN